VDNPEHLHPDWDPERFLEQYRDEMTLAARRKVDSDHDAEEARAAAALKALRKPPGKDVKDLQAWLCKVAINSARDLQRQRNRQASRETVDEAGWERADPRADTLRTVRFRADTLAFLERVWNLLDKSRYEDVALYLDVELERCTEKQLAEQLGISLNRLKGRRRRAGKAVQDAATVAVLIVDPGEGKDRCAVPLALAAGQDVSPELRRKVRTHVRACPPCRRRSADRNALLDVVLAVPGAAVAGGLLLGWLTKLRAANGAVAASAAAVALVAVLVPITRPGPGEAVRVPPDVVTPPRQLPQPQPQPTLPGTSSVPPQPSKPPAGTPARPAPPPSATSEVPPPPRTSGAPEAPGNPGAGGTGRQDTVPAVTGWSAQHRRIVAGDDGACGDEPSTSAVRVTVTSAAKSATLLVTVHGTSFSLPMQGTRNGTEWNARVGPVNEDARGSLGLAAEVAGAGGARAVTSLGSIDVCPCRLGG